MTHPRTPERLLLVMPHHRLVQEAVAAGFRVWSVWDPALRDDVFLDQVELRSEQLLLADFSNGPALRALISETAHAHGIEAILHLGRGDSVQPVAEEAETLGLSLRTGPSRCGC